MNSCVSAFEEGSPATRQSGAPPSTHGATRSRHHRQVFLSLPISTGAKKVIVNKDKHMAAVVGQPAGPTS